MSTVLPAPALPGLSLSSPGWRLFGLVGSLCALPVLVNAQVPLRPLTESAANPENMGSNRPRNGYAEHLRATASTGKVAHPVRSQPYAPIKKPADEGQIPEIEMFVGESRVFPSPGVGRIAVGNGALLTAAALDGKEVILFANGVGTSSLFVWNEDGRYQRVKINIVPGDTSRYAREIAAFLATIPKARAAVIGDKVIVEGDDLSDTDLARIDLLASRYPQIVNFTNRLGFEQMVMLDVKVVEFPVTELRELGLKWGAAGGAALGGIWAPFSRGAASNYQLNITTGQGNGIPITNPGGSSTGIPLPGGLALMSALNLGLNATLNAMAQNGKTAILAEPQLSARNGAKASFLAGGEFPYTVSSINGPTIIFKPYGVKLDILPRVDRHGTVRATIETEVSQIDSSVSTPSGPALLSRKTSTEFNVRSGETIVLSGLVQREQSTSIDKVPGLGDIPVIGALFRSKRFQNKETELVVFVTPTVVDSRTPGLVDRIEKSRERLEEQFGKPPHLSDPLQPGADPGRPTQVRAPAHSASPPAPASAATAVAQPIATTLTPQSFERPQGSTLRVQRDATPLHTGPEDSSEVLLHLGVGSVVTLGEAVPVNSAVGTWIPATVGEVSGWLLQSSVEPAKLQPDLPGLVMPPGGTTPPTFRSLGQPLTVARFPASRALTLAGPDTSPHSLAVLNSRLALRVTPDINAPVLQTLQKGQVVRSLQLAPQGAWTAVEASGQRGWVATQWLQPIAPPTVPAKE